MIFTHPSRECFRIYTWEVIELYRIRFIQYFWTWYKSIPYYFRGSLLEFIAFSSNYIWSYDLCRYDLEMILINNIGSAYRLVLGGHCVCLDSAVISYSGYMFKRGNGPARWDAFEQEVLKYPYAIGLLTCLIRPTYP